MRQRLKVAQSIAHDPEIIIMDEPLNGLDPLGRRKIILIHQGKIFAQGDIHYIRDLIDTHPHIISIKCSAPRQLAQKLILNDFVLKVNFDPQKEILLVETNNRDKFFGLLPVFIAFVVKFSQIFQLSRDIEGIYIFNNMIIAFYLQFLILILALFYGSSVTSEELEGKTLTYLTTRPVSKSSIVVGKYLAYTLLIIFMVTVGVVFSFLVLNLND